MEIKLVILSSDSNPTYIDFWPMVSRQWNKIGIKPVLCYLRAANDQGSISRECGEVIDYDLIEGIPASLQGQLLKIFHASTCGEDVMMTSDIDLLPTPIPQNADRSLYQQWVKDVDDNKYVNAGDGPGPNNRFTLCYHIAKGEVFKEVLDIHGTWEEFASSIFELSRDENWRKQTEKLGIPINNLRRRVDVPWNLDEVWISRKMMEYPDQSIFHYPALSREGVLVRRAWGYYANLLTQGYYTHIGLPRPYKKYRWLCEAAASQQPIPSFFMKWCRLTKRLFNLHRRYRQTVLRKPTRLIHKLTDRLYLYSLSLYFRMKGGKQRIRQRQ